MPQLLTLLHPISSFLEQHILKKNLLFNFFWSYHFYNLFQKSLLSFLAGTCVVWAARGPVFHTRSHINKSPPF